VPTLQGDYPFVVRVTDVLTATATQAYD